MKPDAVVHFAAESHVDRSIFSPQPVFDTNLRGTFNLLETMRAHRVARFIHVSTDEVYGSLEPPLEADEQFPLQPSSPYSAAKAGSDLLALSYHKTYKLPVIVTRASNNYGPYQFPEKLIPLMISNAFDNKPLPVYGDGMQIRDWLYVEDHCRAILTVLEKGRDGEIYNIGGNRSLPNKTVVEQILAITGKPASLIEYVTDRPGHDRRYALSSAKLTARDRLEAADGFRARLKGDGGLVSVESGVDLARAVGRISDVPRQELRQSQRRAGRDHEKATARAGQRALRPHTAFPLPYRSM